MGRPYSKRPGKFLISVPGHDTPKQARAYLLTDQAVADTAAHHANSHPSLDRESRGAIIAADETRANTSESPAHDIPPAETGYFADASAAPTADEALWLALCIAPAEETDVGELLRLTAMSRPTLYRRLADHAKAGAPSRSAAAAGAVTTEMPPR
jgi:hypothetical protein